MEVWSIRPASEHGNVSLLVTMMLSTPYSNGSHFTFLSRAITARRTFYVCSPPFVVLLLEELGCVGILFNGQ